jgi:hypothetical protein
MWYLKKLIIFFVVVIFLVRAEARAEGSFTTLKAVDTPRFTLYFPSSTANQSSSEVDMLRIALGTLDGIYQELSSNLKAYPTKKAILKFLPAEVYYRQSGVPAWTSAMFLRGEITLPIDHSKPLNIAELKRTLRHEYTHSYIAELSGKRCPAWLDEGLAQLVEDTVNPLLEPALKKWIKTEKHVLPFEWLEDGFTGLSAKLVPTAYAQSLFATVSLIQHKQYYRIRNYLRLLKLGLTSDYAFKRAFGESIEQFEEEITDRTISWAESGEALINTKRPDLYQ